MLKLKSLSLIALLALLLMGCGVLDQAASALPANDQQGVAEAAVETEQEAAVEAVEVAAEPTEAPPPTEVPAEEIVPEETVEETPYPNFFKLTWMSSAIILSSSTTWINILVIFSSFKFDLKFSSFFSVYFDHAMKLIFC